MSLECYRDKERIEIFNDATNVYNVKSMKIRGLDTSIAKSVGECLLQISGINLLAP